MTTVELRQRAVNKKPCDLKFGNCTLSFSYNTKFEVTIEEEYIILSRKLISFRLNKEKFNELFTLEYY